MENTQDTRQFRRRMPHPAVADAEKFKQQSEPHKPKPAESEPSSPPVVTPQVNGVPQDPPRLEAQTPTPAPAVSGLTPEQVPNLFSGSSTPPKQEAPGPDISQYQKQIDELKQQLEDSKRELEKANKLSSDLQDFKDDRDLDELLKTVGSEFTSIDPEDAKKLLAPVLKAVRQQAVNSTASLNRKLEDQTQHLQSKVQELETAAADRQVRKIRDTVLRAVPDLEELQKTDAYKAAMMAPIAPHSHILTGQLVAAELERGNTDYVIGVLNRIKQGQPQAESVASVSPSSTGTAQPAAPTGDSDGVLSDDEIADMITQVRMRQMSRQDFQEKMKKHRAAQTAG